MLLSPTVLLRQVTVLVVDDEEALRRYTSRVMEEDGYHVLRARDGIHALALLRESRLPVQLVITDVTMPGMSGAELAAHIAREPYPPPVLFVSGGQGHFDLPGPLLAKPFCAADLRHLAQLMLSGGPGPADSPQIGAVPRSSIPESMPHHGGYRLQANRERPRHFHLPALLR